MSNNLNTGYPSIDETMDQNAFLDACKGLINKKHSEIANRSFKILARTGWNLEKCQGNQLWAIRLVINPLGKENMFVLPDEELFQKSISMVTPDMIAKFMSDSWAFNNTNMVSYSICRSNILQMSMVAVTRGGHQPVFIVKYDKDMDLDFEPILENIEDEIGMEAIEASMKDIVMKRYTSYIDSGIFSASEVIDWDNNSKNTGFEFLDSLFRHAFGGKDEDGEDDDDDEDGDEHDAPFSECSTCEHDGCVFKPSEKSKENNSEQTGIQLTEEDRWLMHKAGQGKFECFMRIAPCLYVSKSTHDALIVIPTFDQMESMDANNSFAAGQYSAMLTMWCRENEYEYRLLPDDPEMTVFENGSLNFKKMMETFDETNITEPTDEEWARIFN